MTYDEARMKSLGNAGFWLLAGMFLWHALVYNGCVPLPLALESAATLRHCTTTTTVICDEPVPCPVAPKPLTK